MKKKNEIPFLFWDSEQIYQDSSVHSNIIMAVTILDSYFFFGSTKKIISKMAKHQKLSRSKINDLKSIV